MCSRGERAEQGNDLGQLLIEFQPLLRGQAGIGDAVEILGSVMLDGCLGLFAGVLGVQLMATDRQEITHWRLYIDQGTHPQQTDVAELDQIVQLVIARVAIEPRANLRPLALEVLDGLPGGHLSSLRAFSAVSVAYSPRSKLAINLSAHLGSGYSSNPNRMAWKYTLYLCGGGTG